MEGMGYGGLQRAAIYEVQKDGLKRALHVWLLSLLKESRKTGTLFTLVEVMYMETLPRKGDVRRMAALAQMKDEKREMRSFSAAAAFAMSTLYIYVPERFYKVGLEARWGWGKLCCLSWW